VKQPRTLADLRADPRVEAVWQEDDGCFVADGYPLSWWVALRPGWLSADGENGLHEPTIAAICTKMRGVTYEPESAS
jgi:hypothetical protein